MTYTSLFASLILAAVIHASFQLSVSTLTLMSGHAIGRKKSHKQLLRLVGSFIIGALLATVTLLSFIATILSTFINSGNFLLLMTVTCGLLMGLGLSVWIFYYRRGSGTVLWLPRGMAGYLTKRAKKTDRSSEAFSLGMTTVIAELLFTFGPLLIAGITLLQLPNLWQLSGIGIYGVVSVLSLLVVGGIVGSGHRLSGVQKWREKNKRFLQFAAGSALLVLGFYLFVFEVLGAML
ncbi:MAG: hypothetical protein L0H38_03130 [bacterium]|nr:hypothetical protein [bacterium]